MPESAISGMMQGIYIAQQNIFVERRHILGGLCSMAPYQNGIDLSRGTLLLSRFCMNLYTRTRSFKFQKSKGCCISLLICNSCSQSFTQPGDMVCQSRDLRLLSSTAGVAAQNIEWNSMLLQDKHLKGAIVHEAEKGCEDSQGKTMRFSEFLCSKILPLCYPLADKPAKVLLEEVKNYHQASIQCRIRVLNKIIHLMGFESIYSLIAHERALKESTLSLQCSSKNDDKSGLATSLKNIVPGDDEHEVTKRLSSVDNSELFQACQTFPCIVLGSGPHVNIYTMTDENSDGADYQYTEIDVENSVKQVEDVNIITVTIPQTPSLDEDEFNQAAARFENNLDPAQYMLQKDKECLHLSMEDKLEITNKVGSKEDHIMDDIKVSSRRSIRNTKRSTASVDYFLDAPIGTVKGLTATQRRKLDLYGFHTVRKLLQHFPRSYLNFQDALGQPVDGQMLNFTGKILSSSLYSWKKYGALRGLIEVIVECQISRADENYSGSNLYCDKMGNKKTIYLHLKRYLAGKSANSWILKNIVSKYPQGSVVAVSGKVMALKEEDHFEMKSYILNIVEEEIDIEGQEHYEKEKIYPIYQSRSPLDPKYIGDCIKRILDELPADIDPLPNSICAKFNLMKLREAYFGIHYPKDHKEAMSARRRFIFDDFFYHQLGLQLWKNEVVNMYTKNNGLVENSTVLEVGSLGIDKWSHLTLKVLRSLPFSLTNSQLKVTSEIIWDLRRPVPMNRLLQGDVGCGKTIVALLAALEVIGSGYQAAFMVPTELLAMQHYENIMSILERINEVERPSVALLTGSTPSTKATSICEGLETGGISLIVGTHSLIEEKVKFASLCFAVIDEQHRFGVVQRGRFSSKVCTTMEQTFVNNTNLEDGQLVENKAFASPHVLVMSATPIPRTLALVLYGDMSLSRIEESPPGRLPVKTFSFYGDKQGFQRAYKMVEDDLGNGGKVFLVYAVIDESKVLPELHAATVEHENISNIFKDYKCDILHGRMKLAEKETAMQKFKAGETQILLSTQIIEIGIDVPDATMMVIINAERFGMAQLHQLRGRIGRSNRQGTCILLASSTDALDRLKLLESSSDGFYLAEKDLHSRGPGNLLGTQQSGHLPEFPIARIETDGDVLEQAHIATLEILQTDDCLEGLPKLKAELSMRNSWNTFVP